MHTLTNPYRYFVIPVYNQIHMDHTIGKYGIKNKNNIIIEFLNSLGGNKIEYPYKSNEYILYQISSKDNRYYLLKLAKKRLIDVHIAGDSDIEDVSTPDYPYIYILVDVKNQRFLTEYKSSVFSSTSTPANILGKIFGSIAEKYSFEVKINPMLRKDHFWSTVHDFDKVIEAEFTLESPNLFDGIIDIEKALKGIKNKYNNVRTTFKLSNESESLSLSKKNEELESTLEYIGNGGGKWKLTVIEGGKKESKESHDHIQKIVIEDEIEKLLDKEASDIEKYFSKVEDVKEDEKTT